MRRVVFVIAVLLSWTGLLAWAAGVGWKSPPQPQEQRQWSGAQFYSVIGTGAAQDKALRITAAAEDSSTLQSRPLEGIDAARFSLLRYRFVDFPRTLELSLVFRRAERPNDVEVVSLPWPGSGTSSFDLSNLPKWRGRIIELGFAQYPTPQLVPPELGFAPFALDEMALWSPSWRGDLAALGTDWLGRWPWTQRSVHALGRDTDTPRAQPIVLCVALAVGIGVLWALLLFGRRGRVLAFVLVGAGWLALDLVWQAGLLWRLDATGDLYSTQSLPQRQERVSDHELRAGALEVETRLRNEPIDTPILVHAGSAYETLRMVWHLAPRNAAPYASAAAGSVAIPRGTIIVLYNVEDWRDDPALRAMVADSERVWPDAPIYRHGFDDESLLVLRYRGKHVR